MEKWKHHTGHNQASIFRHTKLGDTYTLTFQYNNCQTDRSFTIHNNIPI